MPLSALRDYMACANITWAFIAINLYLAVKTSTCSLDLEQLPNFKENQKKDKHWLIWITPIHIIIIIKIGYEKFRSSVSL